VYIGLTVSTKRFQVVISKEGWADEWKLAMQNPLIWKQFGGSPLEVPENYRRNSTLFHSSGASTPTLFLMGNPNLGGIDNDHTVSQLYEALKEQGVKTEYVEYFEGHTFRLAKNRRDALKRTIEWIDLYTQTHD
jgi:dipeptidyl aminopeptidase/acylaminoacyl peptidase